MATVQVLTHQLAMIDDFLIDCLLADTHHFPAEVTQYPVESGSTISDNIRLKPLEVTMECLISNTPIGQLRSLRNAPDESVDDAYDMLQRVYNGRKTVVIRTSLRTYEQMAVEDISIPRASGRGDDLKFTVQFKQIATVKNTRKRVAAPIAHGPGSNTFTPVVYTTPTEYIYINLADNTWYDNAIAAWRKSVRYETRYPHEFWGKWVIDKDRPIDIDEATYDNETVGQHTDAVLRPRLIALQGGKPRPVLYKKRLGPINMLRPNQYVLTGLRANK